MSGPRVLQNFAGRVGHIITADTRVTEALGGALSKLGLSRSLRFGSAMARCFTSGGFTKPDDSVGGRLFIRMGYRAQC